MAKNSNFHQVFPLCCSFMQFSLSTAKQKKRSRKERQRERERGESSGGDSSSSALMSQKRCQRSFRSSSTTAHIQTETCRQTISHTHAQRERLTHMYMLSHTHAHSCTQLSPKSLPHSSFACCDVHARASFYVHVFVRACVCAAFTSFTFIALVVVVVASAICRNS